MVREDLKYTRGGSWRADQTNQQTPEGMKARRAAASTTRPLVGEVSNTEPEQGSGVRRGNARHGLGLSCTGRNRDRCTSPAMTGEQKGAERHSGWYRWKKL